MKRHLQISVNSLIEYTMRSGDLVFEFSCGSSNRSQEGIRAHQKIQASRPPEYLREINISHSFPSQDFIVTVTGRIDGVYVYPDYAIIDEIKSTSHPLDSLENYIKPIHWAQVNTYAYLYALKKYHNSMQTQLTYIHLYSGQSREFHQLLSLNQLANSFHSILNHYLSWISTLENYYLLRNNSIQKLSFPFPSFRPGQQQMSDEIYDTIKNKKQLIIEAPTGIGKTMAALFPAIKAIGSGLINKFFYLTAKTTGRSIVQSTLDNLRQNGLSLKSLTLTAKEKICFSPGSLCHPDECPYARGFYDRINHAIEKSFPLPSFNRDTIESQALQFSICPFEFSLELALWTDAIICDYNYAFDPRVYLKRFFYNDTEPTQHHYTFLVDEANNLVDRSREMFSADLLKKPILELRRSLHNRLKPIYLSLGHINTLLVKLKKECHEMRKPISTPTCPTELIPLLHQFINNTEPWLSKNIKTPFRMELLHMYFQISWFLKISEIYNSHYATIQEIMKEDFHIKLFCIDPSEQLTESLNRAQSVIFFSATLTPLDYYHSILGCNPEAKKITIPSPFPPENLCLCLANFLSTLYHFRPYTQIPITRLINTLVQLHPGNYLAFFPSYEYMKMIYEPFRLMNPYIDTLIQHPGMTENERDDFLQAFSAENRTNGKTLVGFAVMGGVFAEGIDLKGDRLTAAIIVGAGLPAKTPERELIKDYFTDLMGQGFEYAYLYPGMTRVFQAAGRVIRSDTDRGVVLLIEQRLTSPTYSRLFPPHWQPIPISNETDLAETVLPFWNNI